MGTYRKGILGSFTGKVGTVVGSSWNGIDYMKSLPRPSSKAPTDLQMIQRGKMGLAAGFLQPISALVNVGYKSLAVKKTGFNVATAQVINECISGDYPDLVINYPSVLISKGNLTSPWNPGVTPGVASVAITWEDNSTSGTAKPTDKAVLLVYNPAQSQYVFTLEGDERSLLNDTLILPTNFSGDLVHVWMAFYAADKKTISTSLYVGQVTIL